MGSPVWTPQPGPQLMACMCPADIIAFGGSRGGGKSDCAIGRQVQGALEYGYKWNGLFLRKNFKHFNELRRRWDELIRDGLPAKRYGAEGQTNSIRFSNGAKVLMTAIEREEQLEFFQGQQFQEISLEEACQFPFLDAMIERLKGCLRSPHGVTCRMFLTANPGGPGHNQFKARFVTPAPGGGVPIEDDEGETLIFIPSSVDDNKILCEQDPKYVSRLKGIKDPKLRAAWLYGDWDVVAGGFFDDVWNQGVNVLPRFRIPRHWERAMGMDWGSAFPFSIGWYAVSTGETIPELGRALPRGSLVRYAEWYGCKQNSPNVGLKLNSTQVARGILAREANRGEEDLFFDRVADPSMWDQKDGPSVAERMTEEGVVMREGDNKRIPGWDLLRWYLSNYDIPEGLTPTSQKVISREPMFYVTENCDAFIRTVPILERSERNWEDVGDDQEDHVADESRYIVMSRQQSGATLHELETPRHTECEHDWAEIVDPNAAFIEDMDDFLLPQ